MTLQYRDVERGQIVWRDYTVDGQPITAPVDVNSLPPGEYQLRP